LISGLCIFLPAKAPRHMLCVARKLRFSHFSQRPKFSKGALRAVCAMACAFASSRTYHVRRRRCTASLQRNICSAARVFCCKCCGSSAASLPALQLEQYRPAQERGRGQESRGEQSIAWKQLSLQSAFTVKVCCPPPYFSKGKWALPALPLAKKSPAALSKRPIFLGGVAARPESATRV